MRFSLSLRIQVGLFKLQLNSLAVTLETRRELRDRMQGAYTVRNFDARVSIVYLSEILFNLFQISNDEKWYTKLHLSLYKHIYIEYHVGEKEQQRKQNYQPLLWRISVNCSR